MGHERVGLLPKTQKWRGIGGDIPNVGEGGVGVAGIVRQKTENVRDRLSGMERDQSLLAAFKFLVALSVCSRSKTPSMALSELGIELPADPSPLNLAKAIQKWMPTRLPSLEYARMSESAAIDAIAAWSARTERPQDNL